MRYLKKCLFKLTVFAVVFGFVGLVWVPASIAQNSYTIKIGSYDSPLELTLTKSNGEFASTNIKAQVMKRILEDKSHGRIKVKIFPTGQLGDDRESLIMVKEGTMQISCYPSNPITNYVPELLAINIPYMFRDVNVAMGVMEGPEARELNALVLKKMGVRVLAWGWEGPYWHIFTTKKQVRIPADMKGLKIRTNENPGIVAAMKASGGTPTPISWTESYTALQQGVVDGIETATPFIRMGKMGELLKYACINGFYLGPTSILVNEQWFQSLSQGDRLLIQEAAKSAMTALMGLSIWGDGLFNQYLIEKGVDVYFPTVEESELWKQTLRPAMIDWTRKQIGDKWVDKIIKASERVEKTLYGDL